ncbi:hypothetical protein VNO78_07926 [Psophocarpus tetragonolobus]|uniref:Uncharacterized protein n=1 Tax=Psophocarpus tetragonolobus TaxID=3891 RepID=A0AAN9SU40_PSOTE
MHSIPSLNSQDLSSWSSLSCPSEPPDLGNWFSSYEYRSPGPDSNFCVEDSAFGEDHSQIDEKVENVRVGDDGVAEEKVVQSTRICVAEDNHNEDQCLNKNMDTFSSCSLLSEPPDIGKWFSSYVYESPESYTSSFFRDDVSEENEHGKERFVFEVVKEDESRFENAHPKGFVEHDSSFNKTTKDDDSSEMRKNSTTSDISLPENILQPCMQDKTLQHNLGPTNKETLCRNHKSPCCEREGHLMSLDTDRSAVKPPQQLQDNDSIESKTKTEIQHDKLDLSASLAKTFSTRNSTCTSNKENDGFVTTKNSYTRATDEKSWKKPKKILLESSTSAGTAPLAREKQSVTKRKALTEATNLQQQQYNAMGITGKWQCPQKRKPDVGPAMKQLRLERWVRRV